MAIRSFSFAMAIVTILIGCESINTDLSIGNNLTFIETVESDTAFNSVQDWDIGAWDYAFNIVSDTTFKGERAARFEIHDDEEYTANSIRSEITIVKGEYGEIGKESWYSFAVFFPSVGFEYDDQNDIINQWYQSGSPATSIRIEEGTILLETGNDIDLRAEYYIAPVTHNVWNTFVFHFIHSYQSDGLIEVWHNGQKKITVNGGNMYDMHLPKWKIGIYKPPFKFGTSNVKKRIIYFDNIKVGNETSTYQSMIP